jgi:AcrR family transcriptional regulator
MAQAPQIPGPRARIMAIAAEHLQTFGPKRLTVVGIATDAGMTHANVYRYFTSKSALMDALTADWLKPLEDRIAAAVDAPDPAPDKLERMFLELARTYRDVLLKDEHLFAVFVDAFEKSRGVARKHRARVRQLIDRVMEEGIGSGAIAASDRMRAVTLMLDSAFRFIHPSAIRLDREQSANAEERLERVLAATLQALTRPREAMKRHDE